MLGYKRAAIVLIAALGSAVISSRTASAANWTNTGGDFSWSNPANWDAAVPNAVDAVANFLPFDLTGDAAVTLNGDKTVGTLVFGDAVPSNNYSLVAGAPGTSRLVLDVTTGSAVINVVNRTADPFGLPAFVNQTATINAVVAGTDGLTKLGYGGLTLAAANTLTGGINVRAGALNLDFSAPGAPTSNIVAATNALTLGGGTTAGGGTGGTLNVTGAGGATNGQTFAGTTLNFGNNAIRVTQNGATAVNLNLGTVTRNTGAVVNFTLPEAGNLSAANASIPNANGILGGWATIGSGATGDFATNDGAGNIVRYTGYTDVTGATPAIVSAAASNVRVTGVSAPVTFTAGTTDVNSILYNDPTAQTLSLASGSTLRLGATGGIFKTGTENVALTVGVAGSILTAGGAANTAGTLFLTANAPSGDLNGINVASAINNNGTGAVTLVKAGTGAVQINVANNYTGGTYVNHGRLRVSGSATVGTGPVHIAHGGQFYFERAATLSNNFFIAGKGFIEGGGTFSGGALRLNNNGAVLSGTVTLLNDARITARGATAAGATISGKVTGNFSPEFNGASNGADNGGILILSNTTNDWGGDTNILAGSLVVGGTGEVIPNGAGKGNVIINGTYTGSVGGNTNVSYAILNLNGKTETINGLFSAGALDRVFVQSGVAGPATLRVGDNNASGDFAGTVQNGNAAAVVNLTKIGTGVQTLSGINTYTGLTSIENGTLRLGSPTALPGGVVSLGAGTTSGILDLGGFDATLGGLTTAGTGTANTVANSSTANNAFLNLGAGTSTFGGTIQNTTGAGTMLTGLNVTAGTHTLSGASTYTGDTNINGGALVVTGSLAAAGNINLNFPGVLSGAGNGTTTGRVGNVTLNGGTLRPGTSPVDGNVGTLTLNTLTVNSGDLRFDLSTPASSDKVAVSGAATFNGGTLTPASSPVAGVYTLLTAGSLNGTAPALNTPPAGTTRSTYALNFDTAADVITLTVTGSAKSLTWTGATNAAWDVNGTVNWADGVTPEKFFNYDAVTFADGPANRNVTLDTTVTPASVTVNNAVANPYSITGGGGIADTGFIGGTSLTKMGAGTLTLGTVNSYAGPTNVQNGTLRLTTSGALPAASVLTLGAGTTSGVVDLGGFDATVAGLATAGTGAANVIGNSGPSNANLTVAGGNGTFAGVIQDTLPGGSATVGLNVTAGSLTLAGANTYTGNTNISPGATLQVGAGGATGSLGNTFINADGTLAFNRTGTLVVNSFINGGGNLQQLGTGTTVLANDNFYSGTTTIAAGTLQVGNGGTSGSLGGGNVINNGILAFNRTDDVNPTQTIAGTGSVRQEGTGTLTFSAAQTYSGGTVVNHGLLRVNVAGGAGTGAITVNPTATLVVGVALANPIVFAGGTVGPTGGFFTSGEVTAAAGTTSTVTVADPTNLGGTSNDTVVSGTLRGSGNIIVVPATSVTNPDAGNGFRLRGTGASDFSGTITYSQTTKGELQTSVAGPFSPAGTGKLVLTAGTSNAHVDPGAPTATGTYANLLLRNNFTGSTTFGNNVEVTGTGIVNINLVGSAPANSISTLGNLTIGTGQEFGVNTNTGGPVVVAFPTVTLTGNAAFAPRTPGMSGTGGFTGNGNLNLGAIGESAAGSGVAMRGLGILTVTGPATYTGPTTVESGTLRVSGSIASSAGVTVKNAATFNPTASQTVKTLTIENGGTTTLTGAVALKIGDGSLPNPLAVDGTAGNTAKLDLATGGIAVDFAGAAPGPLAAVRDQILAGYSAGTWTGSGITSAAAAADASSKGVGYALASDVLGPTGGTFMGTSVDGTTVLARYTLLGDATVDGAVDFNDLVKLAQNYNIVDGSRQWSTGDFTYDGNTDFNDLVKLAQNYNTALPTEPIPGASLAFQGDLAAAFAAVPEPGALSLLALAACGLAARRRR